MAVGDFGDEQGQRTEAIAALEKASAVGAEGGRSAKKAGQRGRQKDALGTTSHARAAARGTPHCAGRGVVGWGRSHGLLRFRCKSCGRTFVTLTKTPMAHLRKKEKWLDHARAMIEGKPGQTAQLRRSSDDGVPLATSVSARAGCPQAAKLKQDRRSGRDLRPPDPSKADGPICRAARARATRSRASRALSRTIFPFSSPATGRARPSRDAVLPQVDGASMGRALAGVVTQDNHLIGDGGRPIAAAAPAEPGFRSTRCSRQESQPRKRLSAPSTTSKPITAASNSGSTASTASPQEPAKLSWMSALSKPGTTNSNRQTGSKARSETDHTNS